MEKVLILLTQDSEYLSADEGWMLDKKKAAVFYIVS